MSCLSSRPIVKDIRPCTYRQLWVRLNTKASVCEPGPVARSNQTQRLWLRLPLCYPKRRASCFCWVAPVDAFCSVQILQRYFVVVSTLRMCKHTVFLCYLPCSFNQKTSQGSVLNKQRCLICKYGFQMWKRYQGRLSVCLCVCLLMLLLVTYSVHAKYVIHTTHREGRRNEPLFPKVTLFLLKLNMSQIARGRQQFLII